VGAYLAAELIERRPPNPGPEWWLLLDLAADANDQTRRTAPGLDWMLKRTQASERTIYRWIAKLRADGLLRTVQHSKSGGSYGGKGERAVYEVLRE
jgi:hypothetical protein